MFISKFTTYLLVLSIAGFCVTANDDCECSDTVDGKDAAEGSGAAGGVGAVGANGSPGN